MTERVTYRGRFAPTPSGPLHLGSLLTALASYLQARAQGGLWLIRVDNLDQARCLPGMDSVILRQLEAHGLLWDETPRYQSQHIAEYAAALHKLAERDLLYRCICTRAELALTSLPGPDGSVYAGTCRNKRHSDGAAALRLRVTGTTLEFTDGWQGLQQRRLEHEVGDFTVRRADGMTAYQLACAVDEPAQSITEVVRGADLLGSSFRQIHLQRVLGLPVAQYRHLPVLIDTTGRKLSKQNHALAVRSETATANLFHCLRLLGQCPVTELSDSSLTEMLDWAVSHWRAELVPRAAQLAVE
ncbi:MAG: tRNA glutamyl-Q(34) synthetase GluQRS [Stenotrophobium sp.]